MNHSRSVVRRLAVVLMLAGVSVAAAPGGGLSSIRAQDLREWLTYIASDDLEGRAIYSSGLGLAAAYIEDHLREWGARPAGDKGSYLQTVRVLGVKTASHSTLTVEVAGASRTYRDGDGITFPKNVGGKRHLTLDHVEFVGYGLDAPRANHSDFRDRDVRGAAVVWMGAAGPKAVDSQAYRSLLAGRARYATERLQAAASVGPNANAATPSRSAAAASSAFGAEAEIPPADFTTVQRLNNPVPPTVNAGDAFFDFLFSHAPVLYAELKRRAEAQEPLPAFRLQGVKLTFNLDADYEVVRTELSQNIVAIVDGRNPELKDTYVAFGAHYDHVGYAQGETAKGDNGLRRLGAPGRVTADAIDDRIWNGADDDGSGTVALLALVRAFAQGPRPERSLLFVWHTGEERGLLGSRYFADYPTIILDRIVAQLNLDMIGRNRDDEPGEANTVYLIGSDRISTELDRISGAANASLPAPLTIDYELNDPTDLEQLYYRGDHYSYALKGIPAIFFTTGLHPDYHANTDEVSKIEFEKMTRIVQLVYETGTRVANLDHAPARDNPAPRAFRVGKDGK